MSSGLKLEIVVVRFVRWSRQKGLHVVGIKHLIDSLHFFHGFVAESWELLFENMFRETEAEEFAVLRIFSSLEIDLLSHQIVVSVLEMV